MSAGAQRAAKGRIVKKRRKQAVKKNGVLMKMKFTKPERGWIMYDWACSSYATIMMAAIFPAYFSGVAGDGGDMWWGIGTSVATAVMALLSPILGAIGDYKGMKKRLFSTFLAIGLVSTTMCAFLDTWQFMLIGYVFSAIGFNGSNMFYDSFLTDVTTKDRMDTVSSWGYGLGYIGGSTIPFVVCIGIITFGEGFGIDSVLAIKISLLICVLWWSLFSIPILKNCQQQYGNNMPKSNLLGSALGNLLHTIKSMLKNKALLLFMLAYFFYIDGVHTIISMSTAYGASLGLDTTGMILALLVTQIVAFPCAILFGVLSRKAGAINMLIAGVGVYMVICVLGFIMGFGTEEQFLTNDEGLIIFWILAVLVGFVQGGIQALSRSYFGKIIPQERSNEYFGVFDIFGKFAAILGPAIYAFVKAITGRSSLAILGIIVLFVAGGAILVCSRKLLRTNEQ